MLERRSRVYVYTQISINVKRNVTQVQHKVKQPAKNAIKMYSVTW